jgi:uracil-DNA glycosylase
MRQAAAPAKDCALCPRLAEFRQGNRLRYADYCNAPVPSFGGSNARFLVVGLAPGLHGANRTGRPFTGDGAGEILYATLLKHGFARGTYRAAPDDGLTLVDCRITNAVRCVPPGNKPETGEIRTCNNFLAKEIAGLSRLKVLLALGQIAHGAVLRAFGLRASAQRFAHGAEHALPGDVTLLDSFHCSRLNTNTGRLTPAMFSAVIARAQQLVRAA